MSTDSCTPPKIAALAKTAIENLLPCKSKDRYEMAYSKFMQWKSDNNIRSYSENVMLAYFEWLSTTMKPSSLWSIYSMLRATLNIKENNIDISKYPKLIALLKRKSQGFKSRKSQVLSAKQIHTFMSSAPDEKYLFTKVRLVFLTFLLC
jgi:hypothetical protein